MKQYEIRWANLPEPIGRRPVLLLTRTPAYQYLAKVVVAEVTTTVRGIPQEVPLGRREGLGRTSVANLDDVHARGGHGAGQAGQTVFRAPSKISKFRSNWPAAKPGVARLRIRGDALLGETPVGA